ncbi:MAG: hypothetical protein LBD60_03330 [Puniceicoccales bacterium]|jgi:hypothetical protein|nr:hypothetical protein [Puniceicoccales bacterium]
MANNPQSSALYVGALGALLLMGGCKSIGPGSIKNARQEYNDAIARTSDEQLLGNIVRMKHCESPCFMEVGEIIENRKWTARIGPNLSKFGLASNAGKHELGLTAYAEVFQNPTIRYFPVKGEDFTKRMISPIPVAVVLGLSQTGWDIRRVFSLCVERINRLDNASAASGPTPAQKPEYETFAEAIEQMAELYEQNRLVIGLSSRNDLVLRFTDSNPQSQQLKSILGVDPNSSEFHFGSNFLDASSTNLTVRTRSVMEVLFYLSHAVNVPQKDIDAGLVMKTSDENGAIFDWSRHLSGEWIAINCTEGRQRPENAFVSVFYRRKWFFIADNDLNSKSTFIFLNYLFNLQSGNPKAFVPALTVSTS